MKKSIVLVLLAAALSVLAAGCSKEADKVAISESIQEDEKESTDDTQAKEEGWVKEDFYVYDLSGKLIDYPLNNECKFEYNDPEALKIQTYRDAKINDSAKVALADYDFTDFIVTVSKWPIYGSLKEEQKLIEKEFLEKYPNKNDRVLHNDELAAKGLGLYISGKFYEEGDKLVPVPLNSREDNYEECSIYPQYNICFRVAKGKVREIMFYGREEPYE